MGNKRSVELYYLLQAKLLRGIYGKRISRESDLADTAPPIIHLTSIISLQDDDILYFFFEFFPGKLHWYGFMVFILRCFPLVIAFP